MAMCIVVNGNVWYTRAPQLPITIGINPMIVLLIIWLDIILIAMEVIKLQLYIPVVDIELSLIVVLIITSGTVMISMDIIN